MGLNDDSLVYLEQLLLEDPLRGEVIVGTGGARKMRIQLKDNRGKSDQADRKRNKKGMSKMADDRFNSVLSEAEIENNFKSVDAFAGIISGLDDALAYEKGSARAATIARKRSLPSVNVAQTRKDLNMSQKSFAAVLGVSTRTVEAWETGRTTPSPTAKNLIFLISRDHSLVERLQTGS